MEVAFWRKKIGSFDALFERISIAKGNYAYLDRKATAAANGSDPAFAYLLSLKSFPKASIAAFAANPLTPDDFLSAWIALLLNDLNDLNDVNDPRNDSHNVDPRDDRPTGNEFSDHVRVEMCISSMLPACVATSRFAMLQNCIMIEEKMLHAIPWKKSTSLSLFDFGKLAVEGALCENEQTVSAIEYFFLRRSAGSQLNQMSSEERKFTIRPTLEAFFLRSPSKISQFYNLSKLVHAACGNGVEINDVVTATLCAEEKNLDFLILFFKHFGWGDIDAENRYMSYSYITSHPHVFEKSRSVITKLFEATLPLAKITDRIALLSPLLQSRADTKFFCLDDTIGFEGHLLKRCDRIDADLLALSPTKRLIDLDKTGLIPEDVSHSISGMTKVTKVLLKLCDSEKLNFAMQKFKHLCWMLGALLEDNLAIAFQVETCSQKRARRSAFAIEIVQFVRSWSSKWIASAARYGYDDFVFFAIRNGFYIPSKTMSSIAHSPRLTKSCIALMKRGYSLPSQVTQISGSYAHDFTLAKAGVLSRISRSEIGKNFPELLPIIEQAIPMQLEFSWLAGEGGWIGVG